MPYCLYVLTNNVNGKQYAGICVTTVDNRWRRHLASAKGGSKIPLHRAIRKYGADAFQVEHIAEAATHEALKAAEAVVIAQFVTMVPRGYNCTRGGDGSHGFTFTQEHLRKLSQSHVGFKHSEETKKKIGAASRARGQTPETRALMSAITTFRMSAGSIEDRRQRAASLIAACRTPEARARSSEMMRTHPALIAARSKGFPKDAGVRLKMSKKRSTFFSTVEHRQRKNGFPIEYIADVKALLLIGRYNQSEIGRRYGMRASQVWNIKNGKCWQTVQPAPAEEAEARFLDPSWVPVRITESLKFSSVPDAVEANVST